MPARRAALPPAVAGAGQPLERLLVFLPALILPAVGTAADLGGLALLCLLVSMADAGAARLACAGLDDPLAPAFLVLPVLALGLAAGPGPALTLALIAAARPVAGNSAAGMLTGALVLDLALAWLGLEGGGWWLALGAASGLAAGCWRALRDEPAAAFPALAPRVLLVLALGLVLAFYAALLAHEPAFLGLAGPGRHLTLPPLAAALARLALLGLDRQRLPGLDSPAMVLLAGWALAATLLLEG